jgi:hypothetical protein
VKTYFIESETVDTLAGGEDQVATTTVHGVTGGDHLGTGPQDIFQRSLGALFLQRQQVALGAVAITS